MNLDALRDLIYGFLALLVLLDIYMVWLFITDWRKFSSWNDATGGLLKKALIGTALSVLLIEGLAVWGAIVLLNSI